MTSAKTGHRSDIGELEEIARELRLAILDITHHAGCGHTGGSLSAVEILTALYFRIMHIDPSRPDMPDRDRLVLSKGHITPGYYTTLAKRGYFPEATLATYDQVNSILQGHPDMTKTPGVDMSTGSLGQGLSVGIGMALGGAADGREFTTYVVLGDGELQEGQVWEAAMYAGTHRVRRLVAVVDYNKVQLAGKTAEILDLEPLDDKWQAFGWQVGECDGHDIAAVVDALEEATRASLEGPVVVIAHTVKGKGVSFMEDAPEWHARAPNDDEYERAKQEILSS
jgi:transketolase